MSQTQNHEHEEIVVGKYYFRKDCPNKIVLVLKINGNSAIGQVFDTDSGEICSIVIAKQYLRTPWVNHAHLSYHMLMALKRVQDFFGVVVADKG